MVDRDKIPAFRNFPDIRTVLVGTNHATTIKEKGLSEQASRFRRIIGQARHLAIEGSSECGYIPGSYEDFAVSHLSSVEYLEEGLKIVDLTSKYKLDSGLVGVLFSLFVLPDFELVTNMPEFNRQWHERVRKMMYRPFFQEIDFHSSMQTLINSAKLFKGSFSEMYKPLEPIQDYIALIRDYETLGPNSIRFVEKYEDNKVVVVGRGHLEGVAGFLRGTPPNKPLEYDLFYQGLDRETREALRIISEN